MATTSQTEPAENPPRSDYFTKLSGQYARQTGDSTRAMFASTWNDIQAELPITTTSVVHDNAAGPGTAASVIVDKLAGNGIVAPEMLVTDNVPAMVDAARNVFARYDNITAEEMDSQDLKVPDSKFTHSILNISVFLFSDAPRALAEIHRSLQPGGLAALLTWKRFGAGAVIHAAQALVRPDLPPMRLPGKNFYEEGVLAGMVNDVGFDAARMRVMTKQVVVQGEQLEGLKEFMLGDFTKSARAGWTDDEIKSWPGALEQVVKDEMNNYGGVKFEAWVVIARK